MTTIKDQTTSPRPILDVEKLIIDKIRYRLMISGGQCCIGVRNLAGDVARELRIIKRGERTPRQFYTLVDQMLRSAGGVLWMNAYKGTMYEGRMRSAIASRVYTFNAQTAMEAMSQNALQEVAT